MSAMISSGLADERPGKTIGAGMNRSESVINFQVEPVATFESSALQSSWIQRLKPAAFQTSDDAVLQLPLTRLALDVTGNKALNSNLDNAQQLLNRSHIQSSKLNSGHSSCAKSANNDKRWNRNSLGPKGKESSLLKHHSVAELDGRVPAMHQGSPNKMKGFGSFRVKHTNAKFRKPPLPPSKSPGKAGIKADALRRKEKADNFWKVHAIDVKLEQLHNATAGKDILADFASRLDIKEKSTFIGDFQHNVQKLSQDKCFRSTKLTPVISPRGSPLILDQDCVFTSGSTTASLSPEVLEQCKRDNSKNSTDWSKASTEAKRSHVWADPSNREGGASRSLSSHCSSSSSPVGGRISLRNSSEEDGSPLACTGSNQTQQSLKIRTEGIKGCSRIDHAHQGISVAPWKRKSEIFFKSTTDNVHQNGRVPPLVKRSRFSVEAASTSTDRDAQAANEKNEYDGPLSGLWLRRWTSSTPSYSSRNEKSRDKHEKVGGTHTRVGLKRGKHGEFDAPSAAAMAMVGTAARQLELYSSRRRGLKASKAA